MSTKTIKRTGVSFLSIIAIVVGIVLIAQSQNSRADSSCKQGTTISFPYAVQSDSKDVSLGANALVNGNVRSDANVGATGAWSKINGNATAAGTINNIPPFGIKVTGTVTEGAAPEPLPPISESDWENAAAEGGTITGDVLISMLNNPTFIGPVKIDGNLILGPGAAAIIEGPIYVTGNIILGMNSSFFIDASFGAAGTVVMAKGTILLEGNAKAGANGSGFLLLVSSQNTGDNSIDVQSNPGNSVVFYSLNGGVLLEPSSNGDITAVYGQKVNIGNNATINYVPGLSLATFICPSPTPTPTPTPTETSSPTPTPSGSVTPTPTPSGSVSPTPTPSGSVTPTPTPSGSVSPAPTPTPTPTPPGDTTLFVITVVNNTHGGGIVPSDIVVHVRSLLQPTLLQPNWILGMLIKTTLADVNNSGTDVSGSPAAGSGAGTYYSLAPGTYNVGENGPPSGYEFKGFENDCAPGGQVVLNFGDHKICTLVNGDINGAFNNPSHGSSGGSGGSVAGASIEIPEPTPTETPAIVIAAAYPTPTPAGEVLGAATTLPNTGFSLDLELLYAMFASMITAGLAMIAFGIGFSPRKFLKKIGK
ncbi:MAG: polymorphic outer membrane protein [Parcubacteria group bacterium Licking1014_17]|nr:MAG: polymorphic outer membrane protein [Parcubacteria group bacterium Licking1014_17]